MTSMHKVGRIASLATSIFVGFAFVLPQTMATQGGGAADGTISGGLFLVCMAAAAMIAVGTAILGRVDAGRSSQPFDKIMLVPLIIVVLGAAMLFATAYLKGSLG